MNLSRSFRTAFPLTLLALVQASAGAVLFIDDFESYAANSTLGTSGPWGTAAGPNGYRVVRDEATATPFAAINQYAELADVGSSSSPAQYIRLQSPQIAAAVGAVTTFSFDFYEPSSSGASAIGVGFANGAGDLNTGGSRLRLTLDDGTIGGTDGSGTTSFTLDTAYRLMVVFNDTTSALSYSGGTIAQKSAHVWLHPLSGGGPVFVGNAATTANTPGTAYTVGFRTFNGDTQSLWVDNVTLAEGAAVIPEPSGWLLGFGLSALLVSRRCRQSGR